MKTLIIGLAILLFCSCGKKSTPAPSNVSILGKWYQIKAISWQYANGSYNTITDNVSRDPNSYIDFGNAISGSINSPGVAAQLFDYNVEGNMLVISLNNQIEADTIKSLTSTTLVLNTPHLDASGDFAQDVYSR